MGKIYLREHQMRALAAVQNALNDGQRRMVVSMLTGTGKGIVLAKTVEMLHRLNRGKILVITSRVVLKEQIENNLFKNTEVFVDSESVAVETVRGIDKLGNDKVYTYRFLVFDDIDLSENIFHVLNCYEKDAVILFTHNPEISCGFFVPEDIVFSYGEKDAVKDGIFTPAMDPKFFGPAVELFAKELLEQFGYMECDSIFQKRDHLCDMVVQKSNRRIWVECKTYKSQAVSPLSADSLLNTIIRKKINQDILHADTVLLIVFSSIPSLQKNEIYNKYKIVVWDIENLIFYSQRSPDLLKRLSQITYFPIDHIKGSPSWEAELAGLSLAFVADKSVSAIKKEADEATMLLHHLESCKTGKKYSSEYEKVCEEILRTLFEANYFNSLTKQHKTEDEHFRMDLIGALKIDQNNEKSMHPLWQMLIQHYNSHFVVFEFKNYTKEIDQNLIYITEKYLFDAALRNVAFVISRKGFSESAKFAAEGCLKEHGKLILDITDKDLKKMLTMNSDEAADYLLVKLENFLMGISK